MFFVEFCLHVLILLVIKDFSLDFCLKVLIISNQELLRRFLHARARLRVTTLPVWNREKMGMPISQRDMMATLLGFGQ